MSEVSEPTPEPTDPETTFTEDDELAAQIEAQFAEAEGLNPDPEYIAALKQLSLVTAQNERKAHMVATKYGITLDEDSRLLKRIVVLIDYLLPRDTTARINFEIYWEQFVAASLEMAHAQGVEQAKQREAAAKGEFVLPPQARTPLWTPDG